MPANGDKLNPVCRVLVDNAALPANARDDMIQITVQEDLDAPAMFAIKLNNWDMEKHQLTWSDDDLFKVGSAVEIQMGYGNQAESLIVGEITGLEPEFSAMTASTVIVRGHDHGHRLLRGRRTRTFKDVKDSDIAQQIAQDLSLKYKGENTNVKLNYVLQRNQTDFEFLQERANRIGYMVIVRDKTLYFLPHQNGSSEVLTLSVSEGLMSFSPRLTTMTQVGEITVKGWDPKEKKAFSSNIETSQKTITMGTNNSGPQEVNKVFGGTGTILQPMFTQAEAELIAEGRFNDMSLGYICGEGVCSGSTGLRAGTVVEFEGLGDRFSGLYYVTSATHSYSSNRGYSTAFIVKRNAT